MKIFMIGDFKNNSGPSNVNRNLIENADYKIVCVKQENKILKLLEIFLKLLMCDVVIISGFGKNNLIFSKIAHFFRKKVIYLMHGCIKYENILCKLNMSEKVIKMELVFLQNVDLVLCVSEMYSKWVKEYYPSISKKVFFLNNGIPKLQKKIYKDDKNNKFVISLIGGNRNIKNNKVVCDAIDQLVDEGYEIETYLYGREYPENEKILSNNIKKRGMVESQVLYEELEKSDLYVCNSIVESFGLSVFDALTCGCDILTSTNVGALSILKVEYNDVIFNTNDIKEIKNKIIFFIEGKHNNKRILQSIEKNSDWKSQTIKLYNICEKIVKGELIYEDKNIN